MKFLTMLTVINPSSKLICLLLIFFWKSFEKSFNPLPHCSVEGFSNEVWRDLRKKTLSVLDLDPVLEPIYRDLQIYFWGRFEHLETFSVPFFPKSGISFIPGICFVELEKELISRFLIMSHQSFDSDSFSWFKFPYFYKNK